MVFFQRFLYHLPYGHYVKIYLIFVASFSSGCKDTKKKRILQIFYCVFEDFLLFLNILTLELLLFLLYLADLLHFFASKKILEIMIFFQRFLRSE